MELVTFDTLAAAKTLERAGFNDIQAEAMVKTISKAVNESVATKADLKVLDESVQGEFKGVQGEFKAVHGEFKAVYSEFKAVRGEIKALDESMRGEFKAVQGEFKAVRGEIKALDESVKGEFKAVHGEFKTIRSEIKALELSMTIKLGAMLFATALFILGVGKFLFS